MKLAIFSLLAVAAASNAADGPSLSGDWKIHTSIAGNESDMSCTLTQKDDALTGKCSSDLGALAITGKVDGKKVTFSYKTEYNGTPLTVVYVATVEAATGFKGAVSVPEFSVDGDFTATPASKQ